MVPGPSSFLKQVGKSAPPPPPLSLSNGIFLLQNPILEQLELHSYDRENHFFLVKLISSFFSGNKLYGQEQLLKISSIFDEHTSF